MLVENRVECIVQTSASKHKRAAAAFARRRGPNHSKEGSFAMADAVNGTRTSVSQTSPTPSRRTLLAGLPAAAVGVAALSAPAFASVAHPDAALLVLEPDLKALSAQYETAQEAWDAAERAYVAERKTLPRARRKRPSELKRLRAKYGVDAARAASREAARRVNACFDDFTNARATTLDGLKAKARWAEDSDEIPPAIVRDLLAM
jgi:hypothetical protein